MTKRYSSKSAPRQSLAARVAESSDVIEIVLNAVWEKNGFDAVKLDVRKVVDYTDYILIVSARSATHALAIAEHLEETLDKFGIKPLGVEGKPYGNWILFDLNDCIVHIFYKPVREFYQLDKLFADAEITLPKEPEWVKVFRKQAEEDF